MRDNFSIYYSVNIVNFILKLYMRSGTFKGRSDHVTMYAPSCATFFTKTHFSAWISMGFL